jgi:hypothetical protein
MFTSGSLLGSARRRNSSSPIWSTTSIPTAGSDAASGISSSKTYTATLKGGGGSTTVNGVTFTGATGLSFSVGANLTVSGNWSLNVLDGQMASLLNGLNYSNTFPATPPISTFIAVSGLTSGATYSSRIYVRCWGSTAGTGRDQSAFIDTGDGSYIAGPTLGFDSGLSGYFECVFTATGNTATIKLDTVVDGNGAHLYAFSNEVM